MGFWVYEFKSRQHFARGVLHLLTCHEHRFQVRNDEMTIRCSNEAVECLKELEAGDDA